MRTDVNVSGNEALKSTEGVPIFDMENTRRDLIALRVKHGADSAIGHRCSNLVGMLRETTPPKELIRRQLAELEQLLAAR